MEVAGEINDYCARGVAINFHKPTVCPNCGRTTSLVRNGKPRRKRWRLELTGVDWYHVQKLRCGRRGKSPSSCGAVITLLPSFFYPRYRYALESVMAVLAARFLRRSQLEIVIVTDSGERQNDTPLVR